MKAVKGCILSTYSISCRCCLPTPLPSHPAPAPWPLPPGGWAQAETPAIPGTQHLSSPGTNLGRVGLLFCSRALPGRLVNGWDTRTTKGLGTALLRDQGVAHSAPGSTAQSGVGRWVTQENPMPRPASHRLCLLTPLGAQAGRWGDGLTMHSDREKRSLCVWPAQLMLTQKHPFQRALYPWVICGSCSTQDLSPHKPVESHGVSFIDKEPPEPS